MSLIDEHIGLLAYSYPHFAHAKVFVFRQWCVLACERSVLRPEDLSGACKYGSQFMRLVFGGCIEGHYEHQYNRITGRLVDLGHDALDVGRMRFPYAHEADYFELPEQQEAMRACLPRVSRWADDFVDEVLGCLCSGTC
jgi:hypothetical protein